METENYSRTDEKIKPCPFCGVKPEDFGTPDEPETLGMACVNDSCFGASEITAKKTWQNAYCWKELDSLLAENRSLKLRYEELEHQTGLTGAERMRLLEENEKLKALCEERGDALGKIDEQRMPELSNDLIKRCMQMTGVWVSLKMIAHTALKAEKQK